MKRKPKGKRRAVKVEKPIDYPHGSPYHVCIRLRAGVEHRHMIPNFVVVEHKCHLKKPRLKYLPKVVGVST